MDSEQRFKTKARKILKDYVPNISKEMMDGIVNDSWNHFERHGTELTEKAGKSIIIQEFGYASRGDVMTPAEKASGKSPHELKKWGHGWREGHTPDIQAAYLEETYRIFMDTSTVLGAIWYCWSDHERCWNCGAPDCPCETAWGLVDTDEAPKPAYHAFSRVARKL